VSATHHAPRAMLAAHYHERAYFCFVARGRFAERAGGSSHACGAGTLIFHPPGDVHADTFGEATRCLNIELPDELGLTAGALADGFARRDQRAAPAIAALAHQIARELRADDPASGLALHGLVLELAAAWARLEPAPRRPAWITEAHRIVHAEFATGLEGRVLAARLGVHPVQLAREFKRAYRVTMTDLMIQLRVDHAAHLLRTTARPLAAIALEAGFTDQSHLARWFRRRLKTTCTAYRTTHR
jgi:AraC family transcriptional regulator